MTLYDHEWPKILQCLHFDKFESQKENFSKLKLAPIGNIFETSLKEVHRFSYPMNDL